MLHDGLTKIIKRRAHFESHSLFLVKAMGFYVKYSSQYVVHLVHSFLTVKSTSFENESLGFVVPENRQTSRIHFAICLL